MIVAEHLRKIFNRGGVNEATALDDLSIHVEKGEFVTIIGSNGAGKSTLLNCLAGTYPVEGGTIRLDGRDVTSWPEYRRARYLGRVFQDPLVGTSASLTIEQNLALAVKRGRRRGLRIGVRNAHRDLFRAQLSVLGLGLEDRLKLSVGLLSGGQRQALTMVMATLIRPKLLLLDEHTAALDPKTARQILELTREIIDGRRLTALMVTHNMHHALDLGNRLIMLHRGRIILDIRGAEKANTSVDDLLERFYSQQGESFATDRGLLSG
ncbi:MAG: ABC transporter ATP-binding protein [Desulfobacterales bacterium]